MANKGGDDFRAAQAIHLHNTMELIAHLVALIEEEKTDEAAEIIRHMDLDESRNVLALTLKLFAQMHTAIHNAMIAQMPDMIVVDLSGMFGEDEDGTKRETP